MKQAGSANLYSIRSGVLDKWNLGLQAKSEGVAKENRVGFESVYCIILVLLSMYPPNR